jgi:hypothetical protein
MTDATNDKQDLDGVMRRIKKLLAIAEDSRADAAEASAAAGMAERIMRKYQIEHADVIEAELKRGGAESFASEDIGSSLNPEARTEQASGWAGILAVAVAGLHDCQARYVTTYKYGKTLRFSGYAADSQMARFTYLYLVQTMAAASRQFLKQEGTTRRDSEAFRRGFSSALRKSLRAATAAKKAEMQGESSSRSLVLVKDTAVSAHFGAVKYTQRGQRTGGMAFEDGFTQGSQVDVTRRGVGTSGSTARLG